MRESLCSLVERLRPNRVAIEYPIFNDLWSEGMYGLFLYSCEALLRTRTDVVFFANNQTKAWARRFLNRPTGWKMSKSDMIDAAKEDVGGGRWSSDEADAYLTAVVGGRFWGLYDEEIQTDDLSAYERKMFTEIRRPFRGRQAGQVLKRGIIHREEDRFFLWSKIEV
jgi:hypothetical protein